MENLSLFGYTVNWTQVHKDLLIVGLIIGLFLVFKIIISFLLKRFEKVVKKTKSDFDDTLHKILKEIKWPLYLILSLYITTSLFDIDGTVHDVLNFLLIFIVAYEAVKVVSILIDFSVKKITKKEKEKDNLFLMFGKLAKIVLWILAIILVLGNLGYNVTSLVAGLGIGGVAVALAVQNILSDIFSSVSIYLDKPFTIGDYIQVGTQEGTVKNIGIKTTRVETLQGEELVLPNNLLTSTEVQNFGRMKKRRVAFDIGISHDNSLTKLKAVPRLVKKAISGVKDAKFDRAHLKKIGRSRLVYEIVYFVLSSDYKKYMDIQQKVDFGVLEILDKEKIQFAKAKLALENLTE